MALTQVSTNGIKDGSLLNADINASAAIAGSKLNPVGLSSVGIGTSSPNQLLSLQNTSAQCQQSLTAATDGSCAIYFGDTDSVNRSVIYHHNTGDYLAFYTAASERMRIDSSGNVGIGVTPTMSAGGGLHVRGPSGHQARLHMTTSNSGDTGNDGFYIIQQGAESTSNDTNFINYETANMKFSTSGSERMRIDSSGNVGIGRTSPAAPLDVASSSEVAINLDGWNFAGGGSSSNIKIGGLSSSQFTRIDFYTSGYDRLRLTSDGNIAFNRPNATVGDTQSGNSTATPKRFVFNNDHSSGYTDASLKLYLFNGGTTRHGFTSGPNYDLQYHSSGSATEAKHTFFTQNAERMRITANGQIMHGCTDVTDSGSSVANNFAFSSDGNPTVVRSHSNMIYGATSNGADRHAMQLVQHRYNRTVFVSAHTNTGITGQHLLFYQGTNVVGGISTSDSATSYSTSSDYRLKENETVISDGITRLKTLIPRRFNWKIDETNTPVDGFFAHEVTAVPEAVTGTKDQVATTDDVSNELKEGDPIYQSIDQSKLVPLLTAALQEAIAKIEVLETKVAALEAA